jgi:hypothetical protein
VLQADLLPPQAARDVADATDLLMTWVAGAAVLRYGVALRRRREKSLLERRTRVIVVVFGVLLLGRGVAWVLPPWPWLLALSFAPASLLPVAMTLFAEGLLRRHAPRWIKIAAVAATMLSLAGNVARAVTGSARWGTWVAWFTASAIVGTLVVIGALLARRDRASLSRAENALIRGCGLVAIVGVPLAVTDFRFDIGPLPVRLGSIAVLLFCYTLLRRPRENATALRWWRDVLRLVGRALLVAGLLLLALPGVRAPLMVPVAALAVTFVLALAVWDRIRQIETGGSEVELLRWLARTPATSLPQFARELRHLSLTADATVLEERDLGAYDREALVRAFAGPHGLVQSLTALRGARGASDPTGGAAVDAFGADALTDLLERNGATHVGLLTREPLRLLVANVPEIPGAADAELALAAVIRRGQFAAALGAGGVRPPATPAAPTTRVP